MLIAIPPILVASVYVQALPAAALAFRRDRPRPVKLIVFAYLFSLATDLLARYVGHRTGNNQWVSLLSVGLFTSIVLLACAEWQATPLERLAFRIAVAPFLLVCGVLVFAVDGTTGFSRFAYPFATLVTLGGTLWTLLRRTYASSTLPVAQTDWFLILLGVAFNAAVTTITSPVGAVLMASQRIDLLARVWQIRAGLVIFAIVLVALGVWQGRTRGERQQ